MLVKNQSSERSKKMNELKKFCADCKTTRTPLWRSGPAGPRTLCNACGIRYRKRKMADANPNPETKSEKPLSSSSSSSNPTGDYDDHHHHHQMNVSLKKRISDLGKQMIVQRSSSPSSQLKRQRSDNSSKKKLGEVEQAAALLMSLSCGSVFA
uniref:GATA-type domain-containing protein n=1 Tax=Opuntia streptacantha TaxID=393608 RepID=A0A7C9CWX1_OPUST